ncbi:diaminopimelate epimerase [Aestuariimicrobium kwangyangense]|uniref:diaminopimelate epimerase n=1 Tax=Aestuariimicrobium kwangyangense TaxID=396389 RepID=UPI0003B750CC
MRRIRFAKGQGTGNDFVIVADRHNTMPLSANDVRTLTDRHFGIGGDGVLRAVKAEHIPEWDGDPDLWFMDYRNADGSIAEMCGNGLRVFVRYLMENDWLNQPRIATRAGERAVQVTNDGTFTVDMGEVTLGGTVEVDLDGRNWSATVVDVGNPHAVVLLDEGTDLAGLPVQQQPRWQPSEAFPEGANVEFVVPTGERSIALRVHERGSGETLSCGTGVVAAAAAFARASGGGPGSYAVTVPGGQLWVGLGEQRATLTGPAVLVATGETSLPD